MKKYLLAIILFIPIHSSAQDQILWVHEDKVKPAMASEYIKINKELVEACKKHNLQNADWSTIRLGNGSFLNIAQLKNMAELDADPFAVLAEKMGKENLQKIWAGYPKCYDQHGSYIVTHKKDLSYMPGNVNLKDYTYAKFHYFYVKPINSKAAAEKIKAIKTLYESKKVKEYFDVYKSGFGTMEEYYVAVVWSKDEMSYLKTSEETEKLLGEDGYKVVNDLYLLSDRYETLDGYEHPELGYTAKK